MPFAPLRLAEHGEGEAIAYAGKLFADLGATVIKVEPPGGDPLRRRGPFRGDKPDPEGSGWFLYLNANKRSLTLDTTTPPGRRPFMDLLAETDVLFLGAAGGRLEDGDLAPDRLARAHPGLVLVSVTPFGWNSPYRDAPAADITLQALGGISLGIGLPGRPPLKLPLEQSAYQAGVSAAIAACGALFAGRGQWIDLAAADVWASFYSGVEVANAHFGRVKKGRAGHHVSGQPYPRTVFPCKDGFFAVQCSVRAHWSGFLKMVGREDLAGHPLFADRIRANDAHCEEADAMFARWFAARAKEEILQLCLRHRIPGAPVYSADEVVAHPQLAERGYFAEVECGGGKITLPTAPYRASFGCPAPRPAPRLGEYHQEFLRERGVSESGRRAAPGVRGDVMAPPLAGIRVVDFGWVWAGAVPGHVLADMGAEVIKIETRTRLDYMRQGRPIVGTEKDPEQNPMFQSVNRGKLSFRVDMTKAEGARLLRDLVALSDVVIENFTPGVLDRYGLGWTALRRARADLIMCSMSAVGQKGPLRDIRTYATMIAGLSGLDAMVGYEGERVLGSQSSYADPNASLHAVFAILAALWQRRRTGEGRFIDLSQWEAGVNVAGEAILDCALNGRVAGTRGTADAAAAPHGNYPVSGDDEWVGVAVTNDAQWSAMVRVLGEPGWAKEPRFGTEEGRRRCRRELDAALARETRRFEGGALVEKLLAAGVPAAPLLDAAGLADHPQFRARRLFQMVEHPVLGALPIYGLPWQVDGEVWRVRKRAPLLGEHNEYMLKTLLGLSDDAIRKRAAAGVFE